MFIFLLSETIWFWSDAFRGFFKKDTLRNNDRYHFLNRCLTTFNLFRYFFVSFHIYAPIFNWISVIWTQILKIWIMFIISNDSVLYSYSQWMKEFELSISFFRQVRKSISLSRPTFINSSVLQPNYFVALVEQMNLSKIPTEYQYMYQTTTWYHCLSLEIPL